MYLERLNRKRDPDNHIRPTSLHESIPTGSGHSRSNCLLCLAVILCLACGEDQTESKNQEGELFVQAIPEGQDFTDELEINLVSSYPATIYYTTDGTQPSGDSGDSEIFTGPIRINSQTLLSFVAVSDTGTWSPTVEELYKKIDNRPPPMPAPRMLDLTANTIFFEGKPGQSDPVVRSVLLRSIGTETVNVRSIRLQSNPRESMFYDPDAFEIISDFREGILAPGDSTLIELQYFPSETLRSDVLRISSDEQRNAGEQSVELWGRIADW